MRPSNRLVGAVAVALVTGIGAGRIWSAENPFTRQYRPTALEWMTLNLQASYGLQCDFAGKPGCINTLFQSHGTDEVWVLSWLHSDVLASDWDQHVRTQKELIRLEATHDKLPMPQIKFLKKLGDGAFEVVP